MTARSAQKKPILYCVLTTPVVPLLTPLLSSCSLPLLSYVSTKPPPQSAYKFYEAENAVTAAEDALRSLDAKMKSVSGATLFFFFFFFSRKSHPR